MPYADSDTVTARLGSYAEVLQGDLEQEDLATFYTTADNLIDGYLAAVATTPLASPYPPLIVICANAIVVRDLFAARMAKDIPQHVKDSYDHALRVLELFAKGTLKLSAPDPDQAAYYDLVFSANCRVFSEIL
ncbi:MAG TPA: DUF1320 family protein [Candidatus Syntrophosphaera sp.]|nr:DUF1320 family protein [Candidatus Syntrophosphaera sp.]